MAPHPDANLVVDAVVMALGRCTPDPDGLVHHSDRGGAYKSFDFCTAVDLAGLQISFGSTGDCFDNAAMETVWSIIKREIAWIRGSIWFERREEGRLYLFEFIEVFHNRQRHQTVLGPSHPGRVRSYLHRLITKTPCPPERVELTDRVAPWVLQQ